MSASLKKRFWKEASARVEDGGFAIYLDERPLKTPTKSSLIVPNRTLADAVVQEWMAQKDTLDPASMPMTRRANAAIDKVTPQRAEVATMLAGYAETDLLCYRATHPSELISRQGIAWDPILDWAASELKARLTTTSGVIHVSQDGGAVRKIAAYIHAMDAFLLTGFHDLVAVSGSVVIALAAVYRAYPDEDLWNRSRVDEIWQSDKWGADAQAEAQAESAKCDFFDGLRFFRLVSKDT